MMMIVFTSRLPSCPNAKGCFALYCKKKKSDFNVKYFNERLLNKGLLFRYFNCWLFSACSDGDSYLKS